MYVCMCIYIYIYMYIYIYIISFAAGTVEIFHAVTFQIDWKIL